MTTFVITGATSFIGRALCRSLVQGGDRVYALCRPGSPGAQLLPDHPGLCRVYADMEHLEEGVSRVAKADVFVNLAWAGTEPSGRADADVHVANVHHALQAMRAARSLGCRLFVESGSQAEYGYVSDTITERTPCHPVQAYGKAKLEVWKRGRDLCRELGLRYVHLRIFSVFGEEDHAHTLIMSTLRRMLRNEACPLSPCTQQWNFLYAEDAARAVAALCRRMLEDPGIEDGVYNLASPDTRPLKEFVEAMKRVTGSHSSLLYGAVQPAIPVSLAPSIRKWERAAGPMEFCPFDEAVRRIAAVLKKEMNER